MSIPIADRRGILMRRWWQWVHIGEAFPQCLAICLTFFELLEDEIKLGLEPGEETTNTSSKGYNGGDEHLF